MMNTCKICGKKVSNGGPLINHMKSCSQVDHDFLKRKTVDSFWLIGLIAADGCINKNYVNITQSGPSGSNTISYISEIVNSNLNISTHQPKIGNKVYSLNIPSIIWQNELKKFGVIKRKTDKLKFPSEKLLNETEEHQISFLRGYIDGDGCVGVYKNKKGSEYLHISFVGTKEFITEACKFYNLKCKIVEKKHCKNLIEVRFNGKSAFKFGQILYQFGGFESKKYKIFKDYESQILSGEIKPKWKLYEEKRIEALERLKNGESVSEISKIIDIPFQTIYEWRGKQ